VGVDARQQPLFAVGRYRFDQQWRLWAAVALLAMASGSSWGLLRAIPRADRSGGALWRSNDRIALCPAGVSGSWAPAAPLGLSGAAARPAGWPDHALLLCHPRGSQAAGAGDLPPTPAENWFP